MNTTNLTYGDALVLFTIVALIILLRWMPEIETYLKNRKVAKIRKRNAEMRAMEAKQRAYERQRREMVKM